MNESILPDWLGPKDQIDEVLFAQHYIYNNPIRYSGGAFFTKEGLLTDTDALRKSIYEEISPFISQSLALRVDRLVEALKLEAAKKPLPYQEMVIHVANGTYHLIEGFTPEKYICRCRLPVSFDENWPEPKLWLRFLEELLEPEDIETLQEYMGYCLIPSTAGQKMLLLIGRGGEGKSRVGVVMHALLGAAAVNGSLEKIEASPFARADLEHRLVMVDDDLSLEGLPSTARIKSIISAEGPMDLERKGLQSYQGRLFCRFLAFGNDTLHARSDTSHGFYRRQLILQVKPRPENRVDDPYLGKKLIQERDAIFCWALLGLLRLIGNNFRFTLSRKSRQILEEAERESSSVSCFLRSQGYIRMDPEGAVSNQSLYRIYREWCEDNSVIPLPARTFVRALRQEPGLTAEYSTHIPIGNGRYARGFQGIRLCSGF